MAYMAKQHKKKNVPFGTVYEFAKQDIVVIAHPIGDHLKGDGHIQVKKDSEDQVDGHGNKDEWSQWEAEPEEGGKICRFKSVKTGKYLRITPKGADAGGDANDEMCVFKVGKKDKCIKLESKKFKAHCLGCVNRKSIMVGGGGSYCNLKVYRN
eukprot:184040_1